MNISYNVPGKLNIVTLFIISMFSVNSFAEEYTFDDSFIKGKHIKADLSKYTSSELSEGTYSLDVYTNGEWKGKYDLKVSKQANGKVGICYDNEMLTKFGISTEELNRSLANTKAFCGPLESWNSSKDVTDDIRKNAFRLDISVPQVYENQYYRGYVDPALWETGIPALNVGWNANVWNSHYSGSNGGDSTFGYLGLDTVGSVKGWAIKSRSDVTWNERQSAKFNSSQLYLEKAIPSIKSVMSAGQISGSGEFFDSLTVRGVSLKTDPEMYPDVMNNFAPLIRGIAQSNALVTVRQDGKIIYEKTVPPGPFILTDLTPSGYGNNLDVTIRESNGSVSNFIVPYNSGAKLLHPGMFKYELLSGKPDGYSYRNKPVIYQASAEYGINNYLTAYAGTAGFDNYKSYLGGLGVNTSLGAFSADVTKAELKTKLKSSKGNMYRTSYTRDFDSTNTSLSFVGLKYSDKGFYNLNNALSFNDGNYWYKGNEKSNISLSLSQQLPDGFGSFHITGRLVDKWETKEKEKQYHVSYNNTFHKLSYSFSLQRLKTSHYGNDNTDTRVSLNFSLPLYFGDNTSNTITSNTTFDNSRHSNTQIGLNGYVGENYDFNYGISTNVGNDKDVSLNAGYKTRFGSLNGSFSQGSGYRQTSLTGSGSVIAHSGGIVFTPDTSDTVAIIEAKGAKGAQISSSLGGEIDGNGYGVVTSLRPYRVNDIQIDPKGSSENVYFNETMKQIVPYANSVTKVSFNTEIQDNLTFKGKLSNGRPFPFGSSVYNTVGVEIGTTGQGGIVFVKNASQSKAYLKLETGNCSFTLPKENSEVVCD